MKNDYILGVAGTDLKGGDFIVQGPGGLWYPIGFAVPKNKLNVSMPKNVIYRLAKSGLIRRML